MNTRQGVNVQLLWLPGIPADRPTLTGALEDQGVRRALRRVIIQNRYGDAANLLDELLALLLPHTATEEGGLFAELRVEGSLTGEVERLCAEHDEIHTVLGAIDRQAPDWPAALEALAAA